jgi:hypothetical protein
VAWEAELLYGAGKAAAVKALLEMNAGIKAFEQRISAPEKVSPPFRTLRPTLPIRPHLMVYRVARRKKEKDHGSPCGQKGHKGHRRSFLPAEEMNHVHDHRLAACEKCAGPLDPENFEESTVPLRNQTYELPQIKPTMRESHLGVAATN